MKQISEIFDRLDLAKISRFLLYGQEYPKISPESHEEQLESVHDDIMKFFEEKFPETKEFLEVESKINHYASVHESVYLEIGMKCGAILSEKLSEPV